MFHDTKIPSGVFLHIEEWRNKTPTPRAKGKMNKKEWGEEHHRLVVGHRGLEDFVEVYIASLRKGDKIK